MTVTEAMAIMNAAMALPDDAPMPMTVGKYKEMVLVIMKNCPSFGPGVDAIDNEVKTAMAHEKKVVS
jgi:hypothetical protein